MAKEAQANKAVEKARRKKDQFSSMGADTVEDEDRKARLLRRGAPQAGKKRLAADKKYGYGGKRGRFKQNDKKDLDSISGFNQRGNFSGGSKGASQPPKRKGKRARTAARSAR